MFRGGQYGPELRMNKTQLGQRHTPPLAGKCEKNKEPRYFGKYRKWLSGRWVTSNICRARTNYDLFFYQRCKALFLQRRWKLIDHGGAPRTKKRLALKNPEKSNIAGNYTYLAIVREIVCYKGNSSAYIGIYGMFLFFLGKQNHNAESGAGYVSGLRMNFSISPFLFLSSSSPPFLSLCAQTIEKHRRVEKRRRKGNKIPFVSQRLFRLGATTRNGERKNAKKKFFYFPI